MSGQLTAAARPARTARQLAQIKAIKKVKGAIRWHERARQKHRKMVTERYQDKMAFQQRHRQHQNNKFGSILEMRRNLREDYRLGPLRPNRAVGHEAPTYGALDGESLRSGNMPVDTHRRLNERRERKGLRPKYPLVVDDKKYFPIAQDDRVMVMTGKDKGKIGVVSYIIEESHDVVIKDLNKYYADASVFRQPEGEEPANKRETEVPFPLHDVRLVIPYPITTKNKDGKVLVSYTDVVVDSLAMERHTTGVDPFTGVDYGNLEFPEEHRFDPETGLPIFNRYIAGTRRRIRWPWEMDAKDKNDERLAAIEEDAKDNDYTGVMDKIKHPIKTIKKLNPFAKKEESKFKPKGTKPKPEVPELSEAEKEQIRLEQRIAQVEQPPERPHSQNPNTRLLDFDDDTARNKAEPSPETNSFYPTLVHPPFPNDLASELRAHDKEVAENAANEKQNWYATPKDVTAEMRAERKAAKMERNKRKGVPNSMKTPMQLRYEVERRKKLEAEKANPRVDKEALMIALGQHMEARRAGRAPKKEQQVAELD